jgi:hypothetical protein
VYSPLALVVVVVTKPVDSLRTVTVAPVCGPCSLFNNFPVIEAWVVCAKRLEEVLNIKSNKKRKQSTFFFMAGLYCIRRKTAFPVLTEYFFTVNYLLPNA